MSTLTTLDTGGPRRPRLAPDFVPGPVTASSPASYSLPAVAAGQRALARAWLWLALAALVGSGLFSVLLVLARTPGVNARLPAGDFFRVALVVHVDLSVLVWFVAIAGLLWSLNLRPARSRAGAALARLPLLLVLQSLARALPVGPAVDGAGALRFGLHASVVAAAVALLAFAWSLAVVPTALAGKAYYEILFWGGGHALQFTWTLLMLAGWLWLATALGLRVPLSPRVALLVFTIALASVFVTPAIYIAHPVASVEHHKLQTWLMRFGGGLAIPPILLALLWSMRRLPSLDAAKRPIFGALAASIGLFAAGGLIGFAISGPNVKIPAHYHGCIVGVTLAFMGLAYHLLPKLGFATPESRLAAWQPWLYGGGQLAHIVGLVWSGGYGVERKVAGAAQVLRTPQEVAGMGLMGLGGLVAILGGLAFVIVVIGALRRREAFAR